MIQCIGISECPMSLLETARARQAPRDMPPDRFGPANKVQSVVV